MENIQKAQVGGVSIAKRLRKGHSLDKKLASAAVRWYYERIAAYEEDSDRDITANEDLELAVKKYLKHKPHRVDYIGHKTKIKLTPQRRLSKRRNKKGQ